VIKLQATHGDFWAMEHRRFELLSDLVAEASWDNIRLVQDGAVAAQRQRLRQRVARTAVIPMVGPIEHRPSLFSWLGLGTSTQLAGEAFDEAIADKSVQAVVLEVDSPGGTVDGVPELAAKIASARGSKPIISISNSMMASAGLWIGTAADMVWAIPSADVGSMGAWSLHMDESAALADEGLVPTIISAGEFKTEGNPFEPLSDPARAEMQRRVDEIYGDFVKTVAKHRGVTAKQAEANFGRGRTMSAQDAKSAGLIDKVGTFEDLLGKFGTSPKAVRTRAGDWEQKLLARRIGDRA